jgi:hypothetical protein
MTEGVISSAFLAFYRYNETAIRQRGENPSVDGCVHLVHGEPVAGKSAPRNYPAAPSELRGVKWGPDSTLSGLQQRKF